MLRFVKSAIDRIALHDRRYSYLFDRYDGDEAVSLDCETTGFDHWADDIVSIAAIRIKGGRICTSEAFHALVKPDAAMPADAIKVHQLRRQDVASGRDIMDVLPELLNFIGARPLVGYWIEFDVRMLNKHMLRLLNIRLPNEQIDVSSLYYDRKYGNAPPGTSIDLRYASIIDDLKLPKLQAHDAFNDALGAAEMYVILNDMRRRGVRIGRERRSEEPRFSSPLGT